MKIMVGEDKYVSAVGKCCESYSRQVNGRESRGERAEALRWEQVGELEER